MLLTVRNVGLILDLYSVDTPERGPTEVAAELGIGKSKAHALMASMAEIGLLRRVAGGRYRAGWRALELERVVRDSSPFRPVAYAVAERLARHCGETVHVAALDVGQVIYIDRLKGSRGVDIPVSTVGATLPAHCSGVGKVLLAYLEPGEVDAILDRRGLAPFTSATITDRDVLYAELHRVRRDGVAHDREEAVEGLACVATAIHDADGSVCAALSIAAPVERFTTSETAYRSAVVRAARAVTDRLRLQSRDPGELAAEPRRPG